MTHTPIQSRRRKTNPSSRRARARARDDRTHGHLRGLRANLPTAKAVTEMSFGNTLAAAPAWPTNKPTAAERRPRRRSTEPHAPAPNEANAPATNESTAPGTNEPIVGRAEFDEQESPSI